MISAEKEKPWKEKQSKRQLALTFCNLADSKYDDLAIIEATWNLKSLSDS